VLLAGLHLDVRDAGALQALGGDVQCMNAGRDLAEGEAAAAVAQHALALIPQGDPRGDDGPAAIVEKRAVDPAGLMRPTVNCPPFRSLQSRPVPFTSRSSARRGSSEPVTALVRTSFTSSRR
jgi:hypothetical protein